MPLSIPQLSFIVPCFNAGRYLGEAIASIRAQKGQFVLKEILVVDDHSTDELTVEELDRLERCGHAQILRHTTRQGPGAARNTGVNAAQAEWICFLDADDVLADEGIQARAAALAYFPDAEWIGGDFVIWHADNSMESRAFFESRPVTQRLLEPSLSQQARSPYRLTETLSAFVQACLAHTCSSMVKRQRIIESGCFDNSLRWAEDYDFFLRLAAICDFIFVPETIFFYRQHTASTTNSPVSWAPAHWHLKSFSKLLHHDSFRAQRPLIKRRMAGFHMENYYFYRKSGQRLQAAGQALKAAYREPGQAQAWRALASAAFKP